MLKIRTCFSGIGAPEKAFKNLGIDFETVDFCEFDKYAETSYCAIHSESKDKNLGDITKVWGRGLPYADGMIWGFPCTDISVAGKQEGVVEGKTRSGLYYDGLRILHETKPAWSLIENVKNLTSKKFKPVFDSILKDLEDEGYNNYWKVLNAKDYGIPQNRERVFILSVRKDIDKQEFQWPEPQELKLKLADLLEQEVDERYYISQEKTDKLLMQLKDGKTYHSQDISYAIDASYYKGPSQSDLVNGKRQTVAIPCLTPDRIEKRQNGRRFKEDGEPMFTLTGQDRHGILINNDKLQLKSDVSSCIDAHYGSGLDNHAQRTGILQVGKLEDINGHDICKRVYSPEGCSPTLPTGTSGNTTPKILEDFYSNREVRVSDDCPTIRAEREGLKVLIPEATKKGYAVAEMGDSINLQHLGSKTRRGRVGKEVAQTLDTRCEQGILSYYYRIRKLIPLECFRLMGFSDEDFYKAKNALNATFYKGKDKSDSQLYKEAGNSIVVTVLMAIFKQMQKAGIIGGEKDA